MKTKLFILTILMFFITGCNEKTEQIDTRFNGLWKYVPESENYILQKITIEDEKIVTFEQREPTGTGSYIYASYNIINDDVNNFEVHRITEWHAITIIYKGNCYISEDPNLLLVQMILEDDDGNQVDLGIRNFIKS